MGRYTINRGGELLRYDTSFADISNVGSHINIIAIILFYYLLRHRLKFFQFFKYYFLYVTYSIFVISKINHGSSFGVFFAINAIFLIYLFRASFASLIIWGSVLTSSLFVIFGDWLIKFYTLMFSKEIQTLFFNASNEKI